jgi:Carbohydrate-binding module 48 (Isoamylase N-terminal domain)
MIGMTDDRDGTEPRWMRAALQVLREEPATNDLWRQRLLHRVASAPRPRRGRDVYLRSWSIRPMNAIAAGLLCALIGAGAAALALGGGDARRAQVAAATSPTPPLPTAVRFTLVAPNASRVALVGDFNGWNPTALPLKRSSDGQRWEIEVPLAPGRYAYSFVVDGALARDPSAPQAAGDDFGSPSSVVMVRGT